MERDAVTPLYSVRRGVRRNRANTVFFGGLPRNVNVLNARMRSVFPSRTSWGSSPVSGSSFNKLAIVSNFFHSFDSIKRRAEARPVWLGLRRRLLELPGVCAGRPLDDADYRR